MICAPGLCETRKHIRRLQRLFDTAVPPLRQASPATWVENAIGHTMGARLEHILIPIGFCFGDERFRTAHDKFPAGKCRARSARTCEAHARTVLERANLLLKIGASDPSRPIAPLAFAMRPD